MGTPAILSAEYSRTTIDVGAFPGIDPEIDRFAVGLTIPLGGGSSIAAQLQHPHGPRRLPLGHCGCGELPLIGRQSHKTERGPRRGRVFRCAHSTPISARAFCRDNRQRLFRLAPPGQVARCNPRAADSASPGNGRLGVAATRTRAGVEHDAAADDAVAAVDLVEAPDRLAAQDTSPLNTQ